MKSSERNPSHHFLADNQEGQIIALMHKYKMTLGTSLGSCRHIPFQLPWSTAGKRIGSELPVLQGFVARMVFKGGL
jgi:hypothetical protein